MEKQHLSEEAFRKLVKNILKEVEGKSIDPMDVEMNSLDGIAGKDEIYLGTEDNKVPSGKMPKSIEMNKKDSDLGKIIKKAIQESNIYLGTKDNKVKNPKSSEETKMNSNDKNAKASSEHLVSVDAKSATHSKDDIKGMHKSDFDSKTSNENDIDVDMDQNDKNIDDNVPKTYVTAGKSPKDGQKTPKVFDKAQNEKDVEPIAKGIQLPEGFENKKYTQKELFSFVISEAKKLI